jgi:hypothetical protein
LIDRQVLELRYWESVEKSGTSTAYQSYLKKYPSGDFSELAKDRSNLFCDWITGPFPTAMNPIPVQRIIGNEILNGI